MGTNAKRRQQGSPRLKQKEQLPLDIPESKPAWAISEQTKREGQHWIPIWRKKLNNEHST
jgi:hypothetical protein